MRKQGSEQVSDFKMLPKDMQINKIEIFPVVVLATMSSGKSTLINAMLGNEILPNKNMACTAKKHLILNDDSIIKPKVYITTDDGYISVVEEDLAKSLKDANDMKNVKDILILGNISGVINTEKSLLIIDTPGPNNSQRISDDEITSDILKNIYEGLLIYVINITQMGIKDDSEFLAKIKKYMSENNKMKILFVINKVDLIDFEKESLSDFIKDIKAYIENHGWSNPDIIPVSAFAANLFKKVINNVKLTRREIKEFYGYYDLFKPLDNRLKSFAVTKKLQNQHNKIKVKDDEFLVSDIIAAIENTGINYLEEYIQEAQILSNDNRVKINIR